MTAASANRILRAIRRQETARGANVPELQKYRLKMYYPEIICASTTIPAGCSKDTVWATSPLDALKFAVSHWKMAEWVEVIV